MVADFDYARAFAGILLENASRGTFEGARRLSSNQGNFCARSEHRACDQHIKPLSLSSALGAWLGMSQIRIAVIGADQELYIVKAVF